MTLQFPLLSPVSFPATEKNKSSIIKMALYKNVVGKASDYNFSISKPFSFKFHDDAAFSQSKTAQKYFPNGLSVDVAANGVNAIVDFVEDSTHIYAIYKYLASGSVFKVDLYKVAKSEILKLSPTFTVQTIYTGICDFESQYHRHMAQDDDYIYVILNAHTDLAKLFVLKIQKSNVTSITSINISTAGLTYIGVFDIDQDSDSLYVAGRSTAGGNDFGGIFQITKSPFAFGLSKTIASNQLGYNLSTLVIPEDNVIFASGSGGDVNYGTMLTNNGTTIEVETKVMITYDADDDNFLTSCNDREYSNKRAYVCTYEGDRPHIKGFNTMKGLSGVGSFYYDDGIFEAVDVSDFVLSLEFNYANKSADSENILQISTRLGIINLYMDSSGVITLNYNRGQGISPVIIAQGSEPTFIGRYGTAQAKQTLRIYIAREAGNVTMKLNDKNCDVLDSSSMVIPFTDMICYLSQDFDRNGGCIEFASIDFYARGAKIIGQSYLNGGLPSQQSGILFDTTLVSKPTAFYRFDEIAISAGNRVNCTANMVYFDSCEASDVIRIGRYNTSDGTLVFSEELNGFGLSSSVVKVLGSKYGLVYFLSSMNISGAITEFNISRINVVNDFGTDRFSFSCNAQNAEFKFAPSTVGAYQDTLVMTGQNFSFDGICYEPDFAYLAKCPIIKMGEGHADMLRFASTPSVISIDYYSKAEAGYTGTKYIYDSYNANFIVNATGKYKKVTKSLPVQSTAEVFESWLDTINLFYDWSDGKLVKDSPVDIYCVMGVSAMRMEIYTALDTNYNFNDEGDPHKCGSDPETALLSNTNVFVTGAKQVEVIDTRLDSRNARSIKFRIKAETGSKYDSFKIFEIRYSPTDAFYIAGDYENA